MTLDESKGDAPEWDHPQGWQEVERTPGGPSARAHGCTCAGPLAINADLSAPLASTRNLSTNAPAEGAKPGTSAR